MNRFILVQSILIILIACSASKKSTTPIPSLGTVTIKEIPEATLPTPIMKDTIPVVFKIDTVFKMSHGSCYGNCPVYDFTILNDGTVIWNGVNNTTKVGVYVAKLDQKKIYELQQQTNQIISQNYKTFYPEKSFEIIADFPVTTYTFYDRSLSKKIKVNNSAPRIIYALQNKIDNWMAAAEWIKIEP